MQTRGKTKRQRTTQRGEEENDSATNDDDVNVPDMSPSAEIENQQHRVTIVLPPFPSTKGKKMLGWALGAGFEPGEYDVVCAKGRFARDHAGNLRFRELVDANLERYRST